MPHRQALIILQKTLTKISASEIFFVRISMVTLETVELGIHGVHVGFRRHNLEVKIIFVFAVAQT